METNKPKAGSDLQRPGKRKRERKDINEHEGSGILFDNLPDDLLIAILSRMSIKDAVSTSLLCSRWRYLWMYTTGTLEFDDRDHAPGTIMADRKFTTMVNHVLKLHIPVESLAIHFSVKDTEYASWDIEDWVHYVMLKEVKRFELDLSLGGDFHCGFEYPKLVRFLTKFPNRMLLPAMRICSSIAHTLAYLGAFGSLRSLRLVHVNIQDEVVQYLLASCPYIEQFCIRASYATKDLEAVDPLPNLKVLELSDCPNIQSLVISAMNLVSCTYQGKEIGVPFKKTPNLSKLTLGGDFCESFIYEPIQHLGYSVQLVELVLNLQSVIHERTIVPLCSPKLSALKRLELNIVSQVGRSLLFFTSLIKASPQLEEFKIKIGYFVASSKQAIRATMPFPEVTSADASGFHHKNLKVISVAGYCGCASEEAFLVHLCEIAPSLDTVLIDTDSDYYWDYRWKQVSSYVVVYRLRKDGGRPMNEEKLWRGIKARLNAKQHAEKLACTFQSKPKFVIT